MGYCERCGNYDGKIKCDCCHKEKKVLVSIDAGYGSQFDGIMHGGPFHFCSDECMKKFVIGWMRK